MLKKRNIVKILGTGSLCLFLLGCREESFLVNQESLVMESKETEVFQENLSENNREQATEPAESKDTEKIELDLQEEEQGIPDVQEIVVHICGAVKEPGVYSLKENQRLYEGIQEAGGFREDADEEYLNQAMYLEDGMKVVVPTKEETDSERVEEKATENGYIQRQENIDKNTFQETTGKVDLNTANEAQLCTLPGIGVSRAKSIIQYREENGFFQKIEDVMKVSGIKEAAFEKIKDYITISK